MPFGLFPFYSMTRIGRRILTPTARITPPTMSAMPATPGLICRSLPPNPSAIPSLSPTTTATCGRTSASPTTSAARNARLREATDGHLQPLWVRHDRRFRIDHDGLGRPQSAGAAYNLERARLQRHRGHGFCAVRHLHRHRHHEPHADTGGRGRDPRERPPPYPH